MQRYLVCYTRDLMLSSQLHGYAEQLKCPFATPTSWDELLVMAADVPVLALVDLSHPDLGLEELSGRLEQLCLVAQAVVAFAPHMHIEKLAAAKASGCDLVLSRGKLLADAMSTLGAFTEPQE